MQILANESLLEIIKDEVPGTGLSGIRKNPGIGAPIGHPK